MTDKKPKYFDFELSAAHEHRGEKFEAGDKIVLREDQCKRLEEMKKGKRLGDAKAPEAVAPASE